MKNLIKKIWNEQVNTSLDFVIIIAVVVIVIVLLLVASGSLILN